MLETILKTIVYFFVVCFVAGMLSACTYVILDDPAVSIPVHDRQPPKRNVCSD